MAVWSDLATRHRTFGPFRTMLTDALLNILLRHLASKYRQVSQLCNAPPCPPNQNDGKSPVQRVCVECGRDAHYLRTVEALTKDSSACESSSTCNGRLYASILQDMAWQLKMPACVGTHRPAMMPGRCGPHDEWNPMWHLTHGWSLKTSSVPGNSFHQTCGIIWLISGAHVKGLSPECGPLHDHLQARLSASA